MVLFVVSFIASVGFNDTISVSIIDGNGEGGLGGKGGSDILISGFVVLNREDRLLLGPVRDIISFNLLPLNPICNGRYICISSFSSK